MKFKVEPKVVWDCPEGIHQATLAEIRDDKNKKNRSKMDVRLVFAIDQLSDDNKTVFVARNFPNSMKYGSELRAVIEDWLGEDFIDENQKGGEFDLRCAIREKAEVVITHKLSEGYEKPFVKIERICPLRTQTTNTYKDIKEGI